MEEASRGFLEQINDITECPVCAETMVDPKMLPCIHTFYFKCLDQHWKDNQPGGKVPCPLCRTEFEIPSGGIATLQSNIFVQKLIDAQKGLYKYETVKCDICSFLKMETPANKLCVECQQNLCVQCSDRHLVVSTTKLHKLISLGDQSELEMRVGFSGTHHCDKHGGKPLDVYCRNCKSSVCTACFFTEHKQHDGSDVEAFANEQKRIIGEHVDKISRLSREVNRQLGIIDMGLKHFPESAAETERVVLEKAEQLKRLVDDHVQILLRDLNLAKSKHMKELSNAKEELQCQKLSLNSFTNYAAEVMQSAPPSYVASVAEQLNSRATELKNLSSHNIETCSVVTLLPTDLQAFMASKKSKKSKNNIIGKFAICENPFINRHLSNQPQLIFTLQFNSRIRGMVVVERELFVVTAESSEVQVYDAVTFEFKSKFPVKGVTKPYGIIATNQSLFISNYENGRIYRVEMPKKVVTSWKVGKPLNCNRLSLTQQGNILVTMHGVNSLCEYTLSGTLLRTIQLPPEMHGPRHAIHLDGDRFLFSHEIDKDGGSHRVCIIENDGRLISSYGGYAGTGPGHLNGPRQLAVDQDGFVFVACVFGEKVVLLNSDLKFVKDIIPSSTNLKRMYTLFYDGYRGNLYVSDVDDNMLSVFKLN